MHQLCEQHSPQRNKIRRHLSNACVESLTNNYVSRIVWDTTCQSNWALGSIQITNCLLQILPSNMSISHRLLEEKARQVPSQPLVRRKNTGPVSASVGVAVAIHLAWFLHRSMSMILGNRLDIVQLYFHNKIVYLFIYGRHFFVHK